MKLKVKDIQNLNGTYIMEVELLEGVILIDDIYKYEKKYKFKVKSIGIIESNLKNTYPLIVIIDPNTEIKKYIGKIFHKEN